MTRLLNGESDADACKLLIHRAYVNVFGRRNFVSALSAVLWEQLEYADLKARPAEKEAADWC
jgi:hypothetical protein